MQIAHGSKIYTVDCPQLLYPLIETHSVQLLHPVDCLRLGVFGSGYFISDISVSVHGGDSPRQTLSRYFTNRQVQVELPTDYCTAYNSDSTVRAEGNPKLNYFKADSGLSYEHWQAAGWIIPEAPEGWFEAYCSHVAGKLPDEVWLPQLLRAKSCVARHAGQVHSASNLRPRQRQTLLNWASPLAFLVRNT